MTHVSIEAFCPDGIAGRQVVVHATAEPGGPQLLVTGPDGAAANEPRDRLRAGIINSGLDWPLQKLTVTVTPAVPGALHSCVDLAAAVAVLTASGQIPPQAFDSVTFVGELGLDGAIRPVSETLGLVATAALHDYETVVVPAGNAHEAALVPGIRIVAASTLTDVVSWATTGTVPATPKTAGPNTTGTPPVGGAAGPLDLSQLPGSWRATRHVLEVAATGGHHMIITAPDGVAALAGRCLLSLLPDLDDAAALQVSALYAAAQLPVPALIRRPPLQTVHRTSSMATVFGARKPGAVTLAHHGVLLLDDAPELDRRILAGLRGPLDTGSVTLARAGGTHVYPAAFQLVLACGTAPGGADVPGRIDRRLAPIADHADLMVTTGGARPGGPADGQSSAVAASRVAAARAAAAQRWAADGYPANAAVPLPRITQRPFRLPPQVAGPADWLLDTGAVSPSGYARILRLAWTVADLAGLDRPGRVEVEQAISLGRGELYD